MILIVDGTIRKDSRTKELGEYLLNKLDNKERNVLKLTDLNLKPLDEETLNFRQNKINEFDFSDSYFELAKDFKNADEIVFISPLYDLSFSSLIKLFIENICILNLTFKYNEMGVPVSLINAKKFYYITSAGGKIMNLEYSYGYIKDVMKSFFGVNESYLIKAENLDIIGYDPALILKETKQEIDKLI